MNAGFHGRGVLFEERPRRHDTRFRAEIHSNDVALGNLFNQTESEQLARLFVRCWFGREEIDVIDDVEEHLGTDQDDDDPFQSDVLLLVEARFDDRDQFQGEVQPFVENLRSFGDGEVVEDLLVETARQRR